MQALTNTRTTIIARLSREIESLRTRRKTTQNKQNLRRLRGERTAYERGNRMPPMMGTTRKYSAPYGYIVTLRLQDAETFLEYGGEDTPIIERDVTILSEKRLTLKQVKRRAVEMFNQEGFKEYGLNYVLHSVIVEAAFHHA